MNIFELLNDKYFLPSKPKLFEAFSGIGCQRMAFNKLGIEVEMIGISEIDKYAIQSYMAIHGETKNYGSITDIESLPQVDVFTWSFPCTDLSKAGKQKGLTNTRSGLVYEVLRILHNTEKKPKVLIMENVVDLVQTKFIKEFNEIQLELEEMGYSNYVETLNAKHYGVAQNRDRVFMVSILGDYYYEFPKPIQLEKRLKDYLEDDVDEKYYLSDKLLNFFQENSIKNEEKGNGFRFKPKNEESIANAVTTLAGNRMDDNFITKPVRIGGLYDDENGKHQAGSIWETEALSPTIDTMQGGNRQPFVMIPEDTIKGYAETNDGDGVYINRPHQKRGVVQKEMIQTLKTSGSDVGVVVSDLKREYCNTLIKDGNVEEYDMVRHSYTNHRLDNSMERKESENGISSALTTRPDTLGVAIQQNGLRIRKLSPIEVWRLMGIDDKDFEKAEQVCSNAQLYKQAGNGIVVDVFAKILETMKGK